MKLTFISSPCRLNCGKLVDLTANARFYWYSTAPAELFRAAADRDHKLNLVFDPVAPASWPIIHHTLIRLQK
jgi:hypothetical protein